MTVIIDSQDGWRQLVEANLLKKSDVDLTGFSQARHYAQCIELAASYGVDFSISPSGTVGQFRKKGTAFLAKTEPA